MRIIEASTLATLAMLTPFVIAGLGVCIAVFGKAFGKFPFQPDEEKTFHWPTLPRMHSKIYVVEKRVGCPKSRQPTRKRAEPRSFI